VEFDSNSKSAKQLKERLIHFFEDLNRPEAAEGGGSDDAAADDGQVSLSVALIVAFTIRTHASIYALYYSSCCSSRNGSRSPTA
jgi:hypothetical protein